LLQRLRAVDPRRPVWVGDVDAQVGELQLPGSMADALGQRQRLRWRRRSKSASTGGSKTSRPGHRLDAIEALMPSMELVASVLTGYFDRLNAARVAQRLARPNSFAPLIVDSLKPEQMAHAVRTWQPTADPVAT
jgi:hypothetical protein